MTGPSETPVLLPADFDPQRIAFLTYDVGHGDKMRKLIADCKRPAHSGRFEVAIAARQVFNAEKQIRHSHNLPKGHRIGTRVAMYSPPGKRDAIMVASYGIVLDDQGTIPGPSVTAFLDNIFIPAALENPSVLVDNLLFADLSTQAMAWSVAANTPVGLACFITHGGFGRNLEHRHDFMLAAENVKTRVYGEANLYTRTFNAKA